VLHWDAVLNPSWTWSSRQQPLPEPWTSSVLALLAAGLLPIVEELTRCLRAQRATQRGTS